MRKMTDKELLQQALDVIEDLGIKEAQEVSKAIKARLEQVENRLVKSYCGGKPNYTTVENMKTIEEIYKDEKKTVKDLNEIILHLRMEIKRLHEIISESKH